MKGVTNREGKGPPAADLLVCFPSKAHLRLMPKPICSPARPPETAARHHQHRHSSNHLHRRSKSSGRGRGGHGSPLFWAKTKPHHRQDSDISEPTSPKVTCAGQIKVRPKPAGSCKNWQSVMEEIERLHDSRKQKKKSAWIEALGFKKEVMQFLTCLRNLRFDFRCFGSFPTAGITSDDDDDDDDEDEDDSYQNSGFKDDDDHDHNSRAVFSKWFMILQENNQEEKKGKMARPCLDDDDGGGPRPCLDDDDGGGPSGPPPPNALLLMRCRSAPAKSWLEEREEEEREEEEEMKRNEERERKQEEEKKQSLVVMRCGSDYSKLSADIAKETWVVGGVKELLSRSRSCKR